jgi:hypothetical protein
MGNSHNRLEKLIHHFSKTYKKTERLLIPDSETYKNLFMKETTRVKNFLNLRSFEIRKERNFELLIHQHQSLIGFWLDELYEATTKKSAKYPKWAIEFITAELEGLLMFMHKRYEFFFNLDEKVPEISLKHIRESLKESVLKLRIQLVKECGNEALATLALMPLKVLINSESKKKITYRHLFYSKRIEKALSEFSSEKFTGNGCSDKPMIQLMVLMNYNNPETCHFLINRIYHQLEMAESIAEKADKLRFLLKEFNQFKEKPHLAFKPFSASLKEQMVEWISEEIIYYTQKGPLPGNTETENKAVKNEDKLQLALSVEVLAMFVRAAKDNKIILNKHNRDVFKYISKHISTKHTETLSVNSLVRKSYMTTDRTKKITIDLLHDLIKTIHRYEE